MPESIFVHTYKSKKNLKLQRGFEVEPLPHLGTLESYIASLLCSPGALFVN